VFDIDLCCPCEWVVFRRLQFIWCHTEHLSGCFVTFSFLVEDDGVQKREKKKYWKYISFHFCDLYCVLIGTMLLIRIKMLFSHPHYWVLVVPTFHQSVFWIISMVKDTYQPQHHDLGSLEALVRQARVFAKYPFLSFFLSFFLSLSLELARNLKLPKCTIFPDGCNQTQRTCQRTSKTHQKQRSPGLSDTSDTIHSSHQTHHYCTSDTSDTADTVIRQIHHTKVGRHIRRSRQIASKLPSDTSHTSDRYIACHAQSSSTITWHIMIKHIKAHSMYQRDTGPPERHRTTIK